MSHLVRALVVATFIATGCASSSSPKHHVVVKNELNVEIFVVWNLSPDDTADMRHAFPDVAGGSGVVLAPGQTVNAKLSAPGHYRWYYDITTPYTFFHGPGVFDIVDGNSDISLNAGGTSTGRPLSGVAASVGDAGAPKQDSGAPTGTCIPAGKACDPASDDCCSVCGLNVARICG